jgi:hypothetical protein
VSTAPDLQHDEVLERLLSELTKTIDDNRKFLKGLKDESIDLDEQLNDEGDHSESEPEEEFEEL